MRSSLNSIFRRLSHTGQHQHEFKADSLLPDSLDQTLPSAEMVLPSYIYKYKIKIRRVLSGQLIETQIVIDTNVIQQRGG
jgi:hypothetical protein